jgi:hypothetical protein
VVERTAALPVLLRFVELAELPVKQLQLLLLHDH